LICGSMAMTKSFVELLNARSGMTGKVKFMAGLLACRLRAVRY
jgi:hypothetical protein